MSRISVWISSWLYYDLPFNFNYSYFLKQRTIWKTEILYIVFSTKFVQIAKIYPVEILYCENASNRHFKTIITLFIWIFFISSKQIIHCSAGVGRTGTYITIDSQIRSLKSRSELQIYKNVCSLRYEFLLLFSRTTKAVDHGHIVVIYCVCSERSTVIQFMLE